MATKQTDTVAMTEEQLDGVSGGPHYSDWNGSRHNVVQFDGVQGGVLRMDKGRRSGLLSGRTPAQNISPPANEHLLPAVQMIGY